MAYQLLLLAASAPPGVSPPRRAALVGLLQLFDARDAQQLTARPGPPARPAPRRALALPCRPAPGA